MDFPQNLPKSLSEVCFGKAKPLKRLALPRRIELLFSP